MIWLALPAAAFPAPVLQAIAFDTAPVSGTPATPSRTGARTLLLPDQAVAYFPPSVAAGTTSAPPILVLLHGAGRDAAGLVGRFAAEADARGIVLLAPSSKGTTWDVIRLSQRLPMIGSSGKLDGPYVFRGTPDSRRVEKAIAELGRYVPVDRSRTVLAGFSDGATFALAMGMTKDAPFAGLIAFSPGLAIPVADRVAERRVLASHGRQDEILSFEWTRKQVLPRLTGAVLNFRPFDGGHHIPDDVVTEFLDAYFGPPAGRAARPIQTGVR